MKEIIEAKIEELVLGIDPDKVDNDLLLKIDTLTRLLAVIKIPNDKRDVGT